MKNYNEIEFSVLSPLTEEQLKQFSNHKVNLDYDGLTIIIASKKHSKRELKTIVNSILNGGQFNRYYKLRNEDAKFN